VVSHRDRYMEIIVYKICHLKKGACVIGLKLIDGD
jgi:hypothetical protein